MLVSTEDKAETQSIAERARQFWQLVDNLPRLLQLVWAAVPQWLLLSLGLTLLTSLLPIVQLFVSKLVVDQVVVVLQAAADDRPQLIQQLILYAGIGFGLSLVEDLFNQTNSYVSTMLGDRFSLYANTQLLEKAVHLDLAHYESPEFHDLLRLAQTGSIYPLQVLRLLLNLLSQGLRLVGLLTLLLRFKGWVILLLVATTAPTFWMSIRYSEFRFWMTRWQMPSRRLADYFEDVLTEGNYAKEVRIFNLGSHLLDEYREIRQTFNQEAQSLAQKQAISQWLISLVSAVGFYGAYALVLWEALQGSITLGDLTLYTGTFQQAQGTMSGILSTIANLYEYSLYIEQYFDFLALEPKVVSLSEANPMPHPIQTGLKLDNVSFTYPGADEPTLKHLTLEVKPQECIALVGANGSGKTTLLKLLTRLYDPDEGQIFLDEQPLQSFDLADLRLNVGVLFQDFVRYPLSVENNIGFGYLPKLDDQDLIQQAATNAGAAELIEGLTGGYKSVLGKMFSGGVDLSGGQWQKIGLARAFMSQAQILVLDEPTAAVDAIAEHDLFQRFRQLTAGKMTFLVSHRFSTVRMADRIVVLKAGEIAEVGSHQDLMARNGLYAEMFTLQASSYNDHQ
jgi:ATP-binding cassette, subfamily B, bacterial